MCLNRFAVSYAFALALAFVACLSPHRPLFAGQAEDEEAIAEREAAARAKKDAAAKGSKSPEAKADDPNAPFKNTGPEKANPFAQDPEPAPTKPAAPKAGNAPAAKLPAPPPANLAPCAVCYGLGIVPNLPYRPFSRFEKEPAPNPECPPPCQLCPKCKTPADVKAGPKQLSDELKSRQVAARAEHPNFETLAGGKSMIQFETPWLTVHSLISDAQNKKVADALEKCAGMLQTNSKSMVVTATRPDQDHLILLDDEPTYFKYIDLTMPQADATHKEMSRKMTGLFFPHKYALAFGKPNGPPAENRAVYSWGRMLMQSATNMKARAWLVEGFGSYCENATLGKNTMYSIAYEANQVKFGKSWNADVKKLATSGQLKHWDEIYNIELEHLKAAEYLHCYSMVSFLIKIDAKRFDKFVLNIKEGMDAGPAIEKAYGKKPTELEAFWKQWIPTQPEK